jgi:hypothetical protein
MSADEGLQIGRRKKAKRIADALRSIGVRATGVRKFGDGEWTNICAIAFRYPPAKSFKLPSAETRALVIAELESDPKDEDVPA